jgi:hypothetical protein
MICKGAKVVLGFKMGWIELGGREGSLWRNVCFSLAYLKPS